jgi:hypothetical protein
MRLLGLGDVEVGPNDHVYSHSRARALLIAATALFAAIALIAYPFAGGWKPGLYFAAVIVLLFVLMIRFVTSRFRPSNWLVRMNDVGVFIHFRSYLNYHLPADDLTVVFITWPEIRSARLVRARTKVSSEQGGVATQMLRYVELELAAPLGPLEEALHAELVERGPKEKRCYGSSSTLYQDYPVRMPAPPFLQVQWSVLPRVQNFLEALRPRTTIAEPLLSRQDFTALRSLSQEEQNKCLRELAHKGETIVAIHTAQKLYGCGLNKAKDLVERMRNQSGAGASS